MKTLLTALLLTGAALALTQDDEDARKRAATRDAIGYAGDSTLVLPVKSLEESLGFYQDVLGFELMLQLGDSFAEVHSATQGLSIGLNVREEPAVGETGLTFGVKDMDKARKALEARGVEFGEVLEIPDTVRLSYFKDPTGNTLVLHQSLMKEE